MGPLLLAALLTGICQQSDSTAFRDEATAELYARARVRHILQDSLVRDYRAVVRTRLDASAGRSRFARRMALLAHESVAAVSWQAPNDLRIEVLGARTKAPIVRLVQGMGGEVEGDMEGEVEEQLVLDRPWFIPRALGDSIRVMGVPEHGALHPLADNAVDYYRFAVTDSVQLVTPQRTVKAILMHVEPRVREASLVAGDMWLDAETADVVRFRMLFLGDFVWEVPRGTTHHDSVRARKENAQANRYLSVEAEIEYALIDGRFWMPYRQFLGITAEIPWLVNVSLPVRAITTFSDYQINVGSPLPFVVPAEALARHDGRTRDAIRVRGDTTSVAEHNGERVRRQRDGYYRGGSWGSGRWEVEVPPLDTLRGFAWNTELDTSFDPLEEQRLRETVAALATLENELPAEWTGRRRFSLAWESAAEILRFNRVQGLSIGLGIQVRPRIPFTSVMAMGRFGVSDLRPNGSLTFRYDGPVGRLDVVGYRMTREVEPWTHGLGVGNSINALVVGHDDADYYLASGAGLSYVWNRGLLRDVAIGVFGERHQGLESVAGSAVADLWGSGVYPPNPPVAEGWVVRGTVGRDARVGWATLRLGIDVLSGGGGTGARGWGGIELPFAVLGRIGSLVVRGGIARGDTVPQLQFRVGGPRTVRGYGYGARSGREFWSAQLDVGLLRSTLLSPVVFIDAGDTFSADPLVSTGVGVSVLGGLFRVNVAKGLRPQADVRFDLLFRASR